VKRREFITLLGGAAAWPLAARAQQPGKVYRLGVLADVTPALGGLFYGLRDLGYVEGQNLIIERRSSEGRAERWSELAAELVGLRVDAIVVSTTRRKQIVDFVLHEHLPAMFQFREYAQLGGLMSYGPNVQDMFRRGANYVDKILKGAKPADLPIEQPTKFELVINLKTAKALGLTIPQTLLATADEVIE
jgi:hypothetical protein